MEKKHLILEVEQSMDTCMMLQYSNTRVIDANGSHPGEPECAIVLEDAVDDDKFVVAALTARQIPKLIEQLNQMKQYLMA